MKCGASNDWCRRNVAMFAVAPSNWGVVNPFEQTDLWGNSREATRWNQTSQPIQSNTQIYIFRSKITWQFLLSTVRFVHNRSLKLTTSVLFGGNSTRYMIYVTPLKTRWWPVESISRRGSGTISRRPASCAAGSTKRPQRGQLGPPRNGEVPGMSGMSG